MAIIYLSSKRIQGLSTDTKPTSVPDNTEFVETNTGDIYKIVSGTWSLLNSATGGGGGGGGSNGTGKGGTSSQNGDASTKIFTIAHGLGTTPTSVSVEPSSIDALGDYQTDFDATNITLTYQTAPPTGTGNLVWIWSASTDITGAGGDVTGSSVHTFTNKTFDADGTGNVISNIENADIKAAANIVTTKLADSTAFVLTSRTNSFGDFNQVFKDDRLLINNPADTFAYTIIATAIGANRNLTLPLLTGNDTVVTEAHTATLTNKTIDADGTGNSITNIENADIKTGAAIAVAKLAAGTDTYVLKTVTGVPTWAAESGGGGGGAPTDAQYITLATNATLTAERVLTAGTGISLTDGGAGAAATLATNSSVPLLSTANTYTGVNTFDLATQHKSLATTPANPTTGYASIYCKDKDATNTGIFSKIKIANVITEVELGVADDSLLLNELADVTNTSPAAGHTLVYSSGSSVYENKALKTRQILTTTYNGTANGARYIGWGSAAGSLGTETSIDHELGFNLTLKRVRIKISTNSRDAGNQVFSMRKNQADVTGTTHTVAFTATTAFDSGEITQSYVSTDDICVKIDVGGTTGTLTAIVTTEYEVTAY